MAHPSKQKGNRFERQIVELCKIWEIACKRAWGSNGEALGMHAEVDCLIEDDFRVQAKVRKKLPKYLIPTEEVDAVVFKQDRGEVLMLVRFEDWLYDKKQEKDLKAIAGKDALRYLKEKNEEER
tara:strand:+ start:1013 stop:1384 length:372 start_codon:yes stop_codon:yes gene_type:complete